MTIRLTTDLAIGLLDRPGSLAQACDTLGRAGVNLDGACGYVTDGRGLFHVLVADSTHARRALMDAGFEILEERQVAVIPVVNEPGAAAALLRRIADAGVNIDLLYATVDGRMVLGGDDPRAMRDALT
jgi:hypothetical protein